MKDVEKLLAVAPDGTVNRDPLIAWGFRYYPRAECWRSVKQTRRLLVARSKIAEEIGIPEKMIAGWENAIRLIELGPDKTPTDLLSVESDGSFVRDPLAKWNLRYHPQSKIWRQARAQRNEVARIDVAKRIGVSVELLLNWETAAYDDWLSNSGAAKKSA